MIKGRDLSLYTLAVVLFLGLSGCGKFDRIDNGGFTEVKFEGKRNGHFQTAAMLTNGIFITAFSDSYVTNIKIADETQPASITLPNGTYSFFAIGYGYSIESFGEEMRCAFKNGANAVVLNGTSQTVSLDFTQLNCSNSAFSPNAAQYNDQLTNTGGTAPNKGPAFAQLDFIFCNQWAGTSGTSLTNIAATQNCSTSGGGIMSPFTNVAKFQVVFPLFKNVNGVYSKTGEAFRSTCGNSWPSTDGFAAFSQYIRYPVGSTAYPGAFPMELETFSESACTSTPVIKSSFSKGLLFAEDSGATFGTALVAPSTTQNRVRVYVREP